MNWERNAYALLVFLLVFGGLAFATMDMTEQAAAKQLIDSNISCGSLSDVQLELIGEYLMEQMHPGEGHELMHRMMGLADNSTEEKAFHISLAKTMYCGQGSGFGMMGGYGMMGRGMMGAGGSSLPYRYGMMGYGYPFSAGWNIFDILLVVLLIGLIILVYVHAWRKLKETRDKK